MQRQEFAALSAFAAIVERGSFARAAEHLGVTPSALSQTIRGLEARMGVRLLHRTTRSVAPSEAGARLMQRLGPALAELDASVVGIAAGAQTGGSLRLNVPRVLARRLFAPLLGRFQAAHPGITLEIVADDSITDIVKGRFDAGVRLGELLDRDMVAVKIGGEVRGVVVASPEYLARRGEPRTPRDLLRHECIRWRSPTSGQIARWEFRRRGRAFELAVEGSLVVNAPELAMHAAIAGAGVAYAEEGEARPFVESGALVRLLDPWLPNFGSFYLYYPHRHVSPALRCWLDFLRAEQVVRRG